MEHSGKETFKPNMASIEHDAVKEARVWNILPLSVCLEPL